MRLLLVLSSLALASCATQPAVGPELAVSADSASVETLSAVELAGMIERGEVVLIDVRSPEEFAESRIAGALNAPIDTFDPAAIPMEDGRETILYCRSSGRSGRAATMLSEFLGTEVRHLEGGILAWGEAELPTIPQEEDAE